MKRITKIEIMKIIAGHVDYAGGVYDCGGLPLSGKDVSYIFFGRVDGLLKSKTTACRAALKRLEVEGYIESSVVTVKPYTKDGRNLYCKERRYRLKGSKISWFKDTDNIKQNEEITLTKEEYKKWN